jgi:ribosome assembly protein YihI (activator of Der GTPase)
MTDKKVAQDQDWLDRLVDRIGEWMDSLTEKDETTKLAAPFEEGTETKT